MTSWTAADIPDQSGRTIVITGANSGLGEVTARQLAERGAHVILACRSIEKGDHVAQSMRGDVTVRKLDLSDLASIRQFVDATDAVDVLVNNAGVMAVPAGRTTDGFETQFGTNFLGPFALTTLLLPHITDRVVTLTSLAARVGRIDFDDLNWERRRYQRWGAYCQSKLADLLFSFELQRRLHRAGSAVKSLAAHPGFSRTELHTHTGSVQGALIKMGTLLTGQTAEQGALPSLYAATAANAKAGALYGPDGIGEVRGNPRQVQPVQAARDPQVARELWERASDLTGIR